MSKDKNSQWINDVLSTWPKNTPKLGTTDSHMIWYFTDGDKRVVMEHTHIELEEVLRVFADFCRSAGFVFHDFGIVDEDGIPLKGLNPIAKLESSEII
jgi:hypothetical protein